MAQKLRVSLADLGAMCGRLETLADEVGGGEAPELGSSSCQAGVAAMSLGYQAQEFAADIRQRVIQLVTLDRQVGADVTAAVGTLGDLSFDEPDTGTASEHKGDDDDNRHNGVQLVDDVKHRWTDNDLYPHDPTAADVHQDGIGDCYLDASMGAIANANPQWIKDRIGYDDKTGNFDVSLWDGNQWKHVTITQDDIETDTNRRGASWLDNGQPNAPLWPAVLEAGYAKLRSPGQSLGGALSNETGIGQGGQTKDALEALTGNRGPNIIATRC